jgi:hypothetical protein
MPKLRYILQEGSYAGTYSLLVLKEEPLSMALSNWVIAGASLIDDFSQDSREVEILNLRNETSDQNDGRAFIVVMGTADWWDLFRLLDPQRSS